MKTATSSVVSYWHVPFESEPTEDCLTMDSEVSWDNNEDWLQVLRPIPPPLHFLPSVLVTSSVREEGSGEWDLPFMCLATGTWWLINMQMEIPYRLVVRRICFISAYSLLSAHFLPAYPPFLLGAH